MSVRFGEGLSDALIDAIRDQHWERAKNILRERDRTVEDAFLTFQYTPVVTQAGGQAANATSEAQVYRIDQQIIIVYSLGGVSVTGTASAPEIYISLPPEFDSTIGTGKKMCGFSWFRTNIAGIHSGGVRLDITNKRLETYPSELAYTSPPPLDLADLDAFGFIVTYQLPESKL